MQGRGFQAKQSRSTRQAEARQQLAQRRVDGHAAEVLGVDVGAHGCHRQLVVAAQPLAHLRRLHSQVFILMRPRCQCRSKLVMFQVAADESYKEQHSWTSLQLLRSSGHALMPCQLFDWLRASLHMQALLGLNTFDRKQQAASCRMLVRQSIRMHAAKPGATAHRTPGEQRAQCSHQHLCSMHAVMRLLTACGQL